VLAAAPDDAPEVPARVAELAGGATVHAVWRNEVGGLTFRLGDGAGRRFVKWQPAGRGVENAVGPRWLADPGPAVAAIGHGLRAWHDALPISGCPFRWAPDDGRPAPAVPERDLVVCHGDACAPNTLVDQPRPVVGSRRRRRARGGRPLGGPGDRHLEHRVELRSGLGRTAARRLRRRPGPGSHRLYRDLCGSAPSG
jgi:aminoglycoside phosphotransferase